MMSMMMLVMLVRMRRVMVMYVKCTKEAGSEINERDANNYKVEPAPDNWDLSDIAKYSTQVFLPGIAEVGNDPHRQQLEASLEEEDNSEDSIEVVKAVHEEGLRLEPGKKGNDTNKEFWNCLDNKDCPHQTSSRVMTKEERRMRASTTVSKYLSSINL